MTKKDLYYRIDEINKIIIRNPVLINNDVIYYAWRFMTHQSISEKELIEALRTIENQIF